MRLSSPSGIVPLNSLSSRNSSATRPAPSVVTPYHSPIGLLVSQFVLTRQFAPPVDSWSATSAALSSATEPGAGVSSGVLGQ